jgi:hypothetical protein
VDSQAVGLPAISRWWRVSDTAGNCNIQNEHPEGVPEAKPMPSTYLSLHYHLIFGTKSRASLIDQPWRSRFHEYLGGTVNGLGGLPQGIGGIADHSKGDPLLGRLRARVEKGFFCLGARQNRDAPFRMAGRLRGVHSWPFIPSCSAKVHCKPGTTSPEENVSRGTRGVVGEDWCRIRPSVSGLNSLHLNVADAATLQGSPCVLEFIR